MAERSVSVPSIGQGAKPFPSGTVAFLFTDIEGSTRRWERDAAAMRAVVERHFAILDAAIAVNHGVHYKTIGDAAQAAFPAVPDAVAAALAGQLALLAEPWESPLRVRMAVHVGAAEPRHGDYLAPALNRLSRLLSAGYGGQILLTRAAADLARDTLPAGASLESLGEHRLRDLQHAESVFQLVHPGLPRDFPPLRSLDIQRHNLPPQPTPLFGRRAEVSRVLELVEQPGVRLLTLTGVGGVGKTRLALQVAAELLPAFPDGVWFVDLAPLHDAALVRQTIARSLDVREEAGRPLADALKDFLATRSLLLVLDNFEHLLDAAPVVAELLAASPTSKALVTSRAPLRLRGEREFPVLPLPVEHPSPITPHPPPAVELFVARAEAAQPSFALTPETLPAVIEICRRLDGLPLAIELAAARVRILPPTQLLARLDDRLRVLTGGPRDAPTRQQTLRQTIAWSYDLLMPEEQTLFRHLAVFAAHPSLEAIAAVAGEKSEIDVLDGITSLVEKSLVQQAEAADDEPRFGMLQTVRAFGLEQLETSGENEQTRDAHARYFARELAQELPELYGPEQGEWLDRCEADHADLRDALHWLLARREIDDALPFVDALWRFWLLRGYFSEGSDALAQVLAAATTAGPPTRPRLLIGAGALAGAMGDYERASALLEEALSLAEAGDDDLTIARAHSAIAAIALDLGDFTRAAHHHEAAVPLYQRAGFPTGTAQALIGLGTLAAYQQQDERAVGLFNEATALFRSLGDDWGVAAAKANLGQLAFAHGDLPGASAHSEEALDIFRRLGDPANTAMLSANLGEVALHQGHLERAATLASDGLTLAREVGDKRALAIGLVILAEVEAARGNATQASDLLREALLLDHEIDDKEGIARGLEVFAALAMASGQPGEAVRALAAADALREAIGAPLHPVYQSARDRILREARGKLAPAAFAQAWASGHSPTAEEAIAAATELI